MTNLEKAYHMRRKNAVAMMDALRRDIETTDRLWLGMDAPPIAPMPERVEPVSGTVRVPVLGTVR